MKKKAGIAVVCTLCCVIAAMVCVQMVLAAPSVKVAADKNEYRPGDTVTITVSSDAAKTTHGYQMDLVYDANTLEFQGADSALPNSWYSEADSVKAGRVRMLAYDDTDDQSAAAKADEKIYAFRFTVKREVKAGVEAKVAVEELSIADQDGKLAPAGASGAAASFRIVAGNTGGESGTQDGSSQTGGNSSGDADSSPASDPAVPGADSSAAGQQPGDNVATGMPKGLIPAVAILTASGLALAAALIAKYKVKAGRGA